MYYTLYDTMLKTKISLYNLNKYAEEGLIPKRTHVIKSRKLIKSRKYYNESDIETIIEFFEATNKELMTVIDVAKYIGVNVYSINVSIKRNQFPKPTVTFKIGTRKYYRKDDLPKLKEIYEKIPLKKPEHPLHKLRKKGYISATSMADLLDMPQITFDNFIKRRIIPKANREVKGYRYKLYYISDSEKIRKLLNDYGYQPNTRRPRNQRKITNGHS